MHYHYHLPPSVKQRREINNQIRSSVDEVYHMVLTFCLSVKFSDPFMPCSCSCSCSFWINLVPRAFLRRGEGGREESLASANHVNFKTQKIECKKFLLGFLIGGDSVTMMTMTGTLWENPLTADRSFNSFLNSSPLICKNAILSHPTFLGV